MRTIQELVSMALVLVGMYLLLANWKGTTEIIKSSGNFFTSNFKTLQARA